MRHRMITALPTATPTGPAGLAAGHAAGLAAALALGVGLGAAVGASPAAADEPGFSVRVSAPDDLAADARARTVTAVAGSENGRCRKVRWTLVIRADGVPLGGLQVTRVEENGAFPVRSQIDGDTATLVDARLDPGLLCRNRTVTGRWQIAYTGRDSGRVRFEAQAFDGRDVLLSAGGAATEATGAAKPEASPSERAESTPTAEPTPDESANAVAPPVAAESDPAAAVPVSAESNLLGPGLIVGGVLVFLGLLILLRLYSRGRAARRQSEPLPTGFYRMP